MADSPWWRHLVQGGLWLILMSLVMGWLARSRGRPRAGHAGVLEHPRSVLILGLVCTGFFLTLAALSTMLPGEGDRTLPPLVFSIFAAISAYPIVEYFRVRYRLGPEGLHFQTLFGGRGVLRWEEITRVRYSQAAKWFRLEGARGQVVRLSVPLTSLPEFARAVCNKNRIKHFRPGGRFLRSLHLTHSLRSGLRYPHSDRHRLLADGRRSRVRQQAQEM